MIRNRRWLEVLIFLLIFGGGAALRLINLTDPPVDLHGWRQLRSASIARMLYYDRLPGVEEAVRDQAHYLGAVYQVMEPLILEELTARTYLLLGGEILWVARVYSILFWMVGGLALYILARRMVSIEGALAALAYYLLLPFAVGHSRVFMPDVLMVMGVVAYALFLYRWSETQSWRWALAAGITGGLAIFVKIFAVFPAAASLGLLSLAAFGLRGTLRRPQFWLILGVMAVIPALYYLVLLPGRADDYLSTWTLPYLRLLLDPWFYVRWAHRLNGLFNLPFVLAALVGTALLPEKPRALSLGLWLGYLLLGLSVPSLIRSHIYYNLLLVPTVALGLVSVGDIFLKQVARLALLWRVFAVLVLLAGLADAVYLARKELTEVDYRQEPAFWKELGEKLPRDGAIAGLTQDYNARINYYGWRFIQYYPYSFDQAMGELAGASFTAGDGNRQYFLDHVGEARYFLVTMPEELDAQPYLKDILAGYPLVMSGERFNLYDLRSK